MSDPTDDDPFFTSSAGNAPAPAPQVPKKRERPLRPSATRFVLLWFVLPVTIVATLVLTGVHHGARYPDAWYTNFVRWLASLE